VLIGVEHYRVIDLLGCLDSDMDDSVVIRAPGIVTQSP
jgi:hypothetical protein